jgi:hypothetical protein
MLQQKYLVVARQNKAALTVTQKAASHAEISSDRQKSGSDKHRPFNSIALKPHPLLSKINNKLKRKQGLKQASNPPKAE